MNIIVPMAGAGSRFEKAGYTFPKPLIEVKGQPMIAKVVENLNLQGKYIFLVQKAHYEKYDLENLLNLIAPGCEIVQIDGLTEGAACTVLKARDLIDNDQPLLISNSDHRTNVKFVICSYIVCNHLICIFHKVTATFPMIYSYCGIT